MQLGVQRIVKSSVHFKRISTQDIACAMRVDITLLWSTRKSVFHYQMRYSCRITNHFTSKPIKSRENQETWRMTENSQHAHKSTGYFKINIYCGSGSRININSRGEFSAHLDPPQRRWNRGWYWSILISQKINILV